MILQLHYEAALAAASARAEGSSVLYDYLFLMHLLLLFATSHSLKTYFHFKFSQEMASLKSVSKVSTKLFYAK